VHLSSCFKAAMYVDGAEMLLGEPEIDEDAFHKLQIEKQQSSCSPSTISKLNSQVFLHFSQLH
jgi:hypothetical protein